VIPPVTEPAHHEASSRPTRLIVWLLVLSLALRLAIAWAPLEWLLRHVLADDSFYYFTIARNFVHGHGFSFDTLAETNGFHPLWMIMLLPIYSLIEDRTLAIHAALTVSALVDTASLVVIFRLLGEIGAAMFVRTVAVVLYGLAPVLFSHAGPMNGMETSVNMLLIFAYLLQYWRILRLERFNRPSALLFGFVSGLLILARTDNIVLIGVTCGLMPTIVESGRRTFPLLATAGLTATLVVAPWIIWSFHNFGTIVQVSGVSVPFMIKSELHEVGWTAVDYLIQFCRNLASIITFFPVHLRDTRILSPSTLAIAAVLLLFTFSAIGSLRNKGGQAVGMTIRYVTVLLMAAVSFVFVHTLRAVYMRGWYYMSIIPICIIVSAILLHYVIDHNPQQKQRLLIIFSLILFYAIAAPTLFETKHGETDKFRMVHAMNSLLAEGSRVGSGNAGVYGYFFEKGIVVGLDGLVNNAAYEHIRSARLEDYCRKVRVGYMVDPVAAFARTARYWDEKQLNPISAMEIIHMELGRTRQDSIALGQIRYDLRK